MSKRMLIVVGLLVLVFVVFVAQGGKKGNAQSGSGSGCQVQVTADVLNIRTSPDGKSAVVGKLNTGAITPAQATQQNGYRKLADNRWASAQFLKPISGSC